MRSLTSLLAVPVLTVIAVVGLAADSEAQKPQEAPVRPAYLVAEVEVTDREAMKTYESLARDSIKGIEIKFLVKARSRTVALEGDAPPPSTLIIRFPSMEEALRWYNSPTYQEAVRIRSKAARSRFYLLEGEPE